MAETKFTKSMITGGHVAKVYSIILQKLASLNFTKFSSTFPTEIEFRRGKSTLFARHLLEVKTTLNVHFDQVPEGVYVKFDYTLGVPSSYVNKGNNELEREFVKLKDEVLREAGHPVTQGKTCATCKNPISNIDKFCKNCGTPILQTENPQESALTIDSQTVSNVVITKEESREKILQMEPSIVEMVKTIEEQSHTQPDAEQILRRSARASANEERDAFLFRTIEGMRSNIVELEEFFKKLTEGNITLNRVHLDEFGTIRRHVNANLRIASNLLDIQKIETNNFTMIKNSHSLSEIILKKTATLKKEVESQHVTLTHEIQPMITCYCDRSSIERVIENLIFNAIEFCHKINNGHVHVSLQRNNEIAKIIVKDNGIGIRTENIERIFNKFYIIDPTLNQEYNETSPGLFASKWIIEHHEGGIWAESDGLGKGAEIHVSLPLSTQSAGTLKKVD